jgi:hypothetical protein
VNRADHRPFGELILEWRDYCTVLHVEEAPPVIRIHAEMLDSLRHGHKYFSLVGDVLTIDGSNQRVVYRIGEYDQQTDAYRAEWPD